MIEKERTIARLRKADIAEILRIQAESRLAEWREQDYRDEIRRSDSLAFVAKAKSTNKISGFIIARLITIGNYHNSINDSIFVQNTKKQNAANTPDDKRMEDAHRTESAQTERTKSEIEIYNLAVEATNRRKGIGNLLLKRIRRIAAEKKAGSIWLEVRESNLPAVRFYENIGFTVIYQRKNFYTNPPENALVMRLAVSGGGKKIERAETPSETR